MMTRDEKQQLAEAWVGAHELYGKTVSDAALKIVIMTLSNHAFEDVTRGLTAHITNPDTGQFPPKPADIIRAIEGDTHSAALQAFSKAIAAASSVGGDRSVCFDDRLTMRVIEDMGGWIRLCESQLDDHPFLQAEFGRRYRGYRAKPPADFPAKLIGRIEVHNSVQWPEKLLPVVLIGNQKRAGLVHENGGESVLKRLERGEVVQPLPDMMKVIEGGRR